MLIFATCLVFGLVLLVWSADKFVSSSSAVASFYGFPPLLIGMIIVGFGTSAPELLVSSLSAYQGNSGIALGNAYGSNISNIALILGATAMLMPIAVNSQVLKKELPLLLLVSAISYGLIRDGVLSRWDAIILLILFTALMIWSIRQSRNSSDSLAVKVDRVQNISREYFYLIGGLCLLIASSRLLVYGAVGIAEGLGVSDVVIGLTIVAVGTSLPEFASSIVAARKGESDLALGNIVGSNLFNSLAVIGLAGLIRPLEVAPEILSRDLPMMLGLTLLLFLFGFGFKKGRAGRINRVEGVLFLASYLIYLWMVI